MIRERDDYLNAEPAQIEVIDEDLIASYVKHAKGRSLRVCSDYNLYRGEEILFIPAHDENYQFHWKHDLPLRVKRGYEVIDVEPIEIYLYCPKEAYKKYKKLYSHNIE